MVDSPSMSYIKGSGLAESRSSRRSGWLPLLKMEVGRVTCGKYITALDNGSQP